MKHFTKNALLLITVLSLCSNFLFSQSGEINIRYIGNCGLYMTDGDKNVYIDFPYKSGAHHYAEYDKSELANIKQEPVFIYTHKHSDHYSGRLLRKMKGSKYGPWNVEKLSELNDTVKEFSIEAFETDHRFSFHHYSYLITWHGKKIYLSGDTENADTIEKVRNIDWAFVPAWLVLDMLKKSMKVDAKMFAMYHIGPRDNISSEDPKILLLDKQGMMISIPY